MKSKRTENVIPIQLCWNCGYGIDRASSPTEPAHVPKPGDFSVCLSCGAYSVFTPEGSLRKVTDADLAGLRPEEKALLERIEYARSRVVTPDKLAGMRGSKN